MNRRELLTALLALPALLFPWRVKPKDGIGKKISLLPGPFRHVEIAALGNLDSLNGQVIVCYCEMGDGIHKAMGYTDVCFPDYLECRERDGRYLIYGTESGELIGELMVMEV